MEDLIHVFHAPLMPRLLWDAFENLQYDRPFNALLCAILNRDDKLGSACLQVNSRHATLSSLHDQGTILHAYVNWILRAQGGGWRGKPHHFFVTDIQPANVLYNLLALGVDPTIKDYRGMTAGAILNMRYEAMKANTCGGGPPPSTVCMQLQFMWKLVKFLRQAESDTDRQRTKELLVVGKQHPKTSRMPLLWTLPPDIARQILLDLRVSPKIQYVTSFYFG